MVSGCRFVACVIVTGLVASAQPNVLAQEDRAPTYQRSPVHRPPAYGPYFPRSSVQAGSFQRPYPYHLDYYRQRYGGGYEPYFGNLYGSPRIVGTQPFAFSPYPNNQLPTHAPPAQALLAAPYIECPHCQQAVQLQWQTPPAPTEAPTANQ